MQEHEAWLNGEPYDNDAFAEMEDEITPERKVVVNAGEIVENLEKLLRIENVPRLKRGIDTIKGLVQVVTREDPVHEHLAIEQHTPGYDFLMTELEQINNTQSAERIHYYIRRLMKGLTEVKTSNINDINLSRWKEYDNILTDSLWVLDRRDASGAHLGWYWGNFVPQIPQQMLLRYTKQSDWVLDPFMGSGTTLIEARRMGRNAVGVEIQDGVARQAKMLVECEQSPIETVQQVIVGDSNAIDYHAELRRLGISSVQLLIMHPPYWDILKFSDSQDDLCNAPTLESYLEQLGKTLRKTYEVLDRRRYMVMVMGDKYHKGELIPLAFHSMQEALKCGYKLKSMVVKNFEETRGKMNSKELWRYRSIAGGFYLFKHEYIMIFRKP